MTGKIIKAALIAAFAAAAAWSFHYVNGQAARKYILPESYAKAGAAIKEMFPVYRQVRNRGVADKLYEEKLVTDEQYAMFFVKGYVEPSDEAMGEVLFGKGYLTDEQYASLLESGMTDEEIYELVDRAYVLPTAARLALYGAWLAGALAVGYGLRKMLARIPGKIEGDSVLPLM